jgi:peptidoglycan/xylan/chitin deacetylase (PgdA/CDA1 family)
MALSRLVAGLERGEIEHGSVALTFDDAYLETLVVVEPILAELEIPATVFVTTSSLGQELWWDRLHRVLSTRGEAEKTLQIRAGAFEYSGATRAGKGRNGLLMDLYRGLLAASEEDRLAAVSAIEEWAGPGPAEPPRSRVLSREELVTLAKAPQIDIGSHTVTHPMMARLKREEQARELGPSREFLEDLLGRPVPWFSYPNGSFSPVTRQLVEEAGFKGACGSRNDVVTSQSDRFLLPRFWPVNIPGALSKPLKLWLKP